MKTLISLLALAALSVAAFAQCEAKAQACGAETKKCCKVEAAERQMAAESMRPFDARDAEFLAMAEKMKSKSEGKSACCKSTAEAVVMKAEKGCCNAKGELAKFKVFVAGEGYQFFGCEGSASKGRTEWVAKGAKVGKIQKVSSKKMI